jgi:hypothetical protein
MSGKKVSGTIGIIGKCRLRNELYGREIYHSLSRRDYSYKPRVAQRTRGWKKKRIFRPRRGRSEEAQEKICYPFGVGRVLGGHS